MASLKESPQYHKMLLRLREERKEGGKNKKITDAMRMADIYIKANSVGGKVEDSQVYDNAINSILLPFADDLKVMNKIETIRDKKEKLEVTKMKNENSLVSFKNEFIDNLSDIVEGSYANPMILFENMASYYAGSLEELDLRIDGGTRVDDEGNEIEVISTIKQSESIEKYRNELSIKTNNLINLFHSFYSENEESGLMGPEETGAFGVFIQTNPQTGAIVDIDVDVVDSITGTKKGFMLTDSLYGRVPVYTNTFLNGKKGRIGETIYEYDSEERILKVEKSGIGSFLSKVGGWVEAGFSKEKTLESEAEERRNINLSGTLFDYNQIPTGNTVRDSRGNHYWYGSDNYLYQIENLKKENLDNETAVFLGHPDFIKAKFIANEKGEKRVISREAFNEYRGLTPNIIPSGIPSSEAITPTTQIGTKEQVAPSGISPLSVKEKGGKIVSGKSPLFSSGQYKTKEVIKKGEDYFKPKTSDSSLTIKKEGNKIVPIKF